MSQKLKNKIRGYSRLNSAIIHKNYIQMRTLLRNKINVNKINSTAQPPLECAIECKDSYAMKILIKYGGDINTIDKDGNNLLMKCGNNNDKIVKMLISRKVNLNHHNRHNDTPLTYLIKHKYDHSLIESIINKCNVRNCGVLSLIKDSENDIKLLELLLKKGININTIDSNGNTPLMLALKKGYNNKAKFLIDHKSKINARNKKGQFPLLMTEDPDMIMSLVESMACIDYRDRRGNCLLQRSIEIDIGLTNRLLDFGVSPFVTNNMGYNMVTSTVLFMHSKNSKELLGILLKMKADINSKDSMGKTPLMYAIQMSRTSIVTLLLKNGACVTDRDNDGYCPFLYSVNSELSDGTVRSILRKRDPDTIKTNDGITPLMVASRTGNIKKIFSFLKDESRALDIDNNGNNFVMHFVMFCGPTHWSEIQKCNMVYPLISYWADYTMVNKKNYDLFLLSFHRGEQPYLPSAEKLLTKIPLNNKYHNNETILTRLAQLSNKRSNVDVLKGLLKKVESGELDINAQNDKGDNVMHIVVRRNVSQYIKHLLKHKAKIDVKNSMDETALDIARRGNASILSLFHNI